MNKDSINTIGRNQTSREDALLFKVDEVEGLTFNLDKDFSEWSDFDSWENMSSQQWIFLRAMDVFLGQKIDLKCDCCETIELNQLELKNISNQKCHGIKSAYMIDMIVGEISLAKEIRESDGTYSA